MQVKEILRVKGNRLVSIEPAGRGVEGTAQLSCGGAHLVGGGPGTVRRTGGVGAQTGDGHAALACCGST